MTTPAEIAVLVEHFDRNLSANRVTKNTQRYDIWETVASVGKLIS